MNRIVLIGNGFDLAHGLPTRYQDFIDWYREQRMYALFKEGSPCSEDTLCSVRLGGDHPISLSYWLNSIFRHTQNITSKSFWSTLRDSNYRRIVTIKDSPLMERINKSIETKKWVDIENEYYELLKRYIFIEQLTSEQKSTLVKELDTQLSYLQQKLTEYLFGIQIDEQIVLPTIKESLFAPIKAEEISVEWKKWFEGEVLSCLSRDIIELTKKAIRYGYPKDSLHNFVEGLSAFHSKEKAEFNARFGDYEWDLLTLPDQILFLSFNYTSTIDLYCPQDDNYFDINHIHGTLSKPESIIFGYGDELDEKYKEIRNQNNNDYLHNIKSIRYLETNNYRKMLQFIDSDKFQVYIMGHSCGNSDRTLLNTLFEHKNCISIKPFYYTWLEKDDKGNEQVKDNYLELVQNISRNFTDMKLMRDRVVNKTYCKEITK